MTNAQMLIDGLQSIAIVMLCVAWLRADGRR
jgi:hypothetical protein